MLGLIHAFFSIHMRADQIVGGTAINFLAARGDRLLLHPDLRAERDARARASRTSRTSSSTSSNHIPPQDSYGGTSFWYQAFGHLNLMIWVLFALVIVVAYFVMFRTSIGLRLRSVGEHPRAADTVGIDVYKTRYGAVILSGMIASLGGAYLAIGYVHSFTENMTAGPRVHRARRADRRQLAARRRLRVRAPVRLLRRARRPRVQGYGYESQVLVQALPVRGHADRGRSA